MVDGQQVKDAGAGGVEAYLAEGIRGRPHYLGADVIGGVEEVNGVARGGFALAHLFGGVVQPHDAGADIGYKRPGQDEGLAVDIVEPLRRIPGQLYVLFLVFPHRHDIGIVEQDIGRHQGRVIKEPNAHLLLVFGRFLLELGHALHPAHGDKAVENPGQLAVGGDVGLYEKDGAFRVDAGRQEQPGDLAGPGLQNLGVLLDGDGMKVHDAEDIVVVLLTGYPVLDSSQVVADHEGARRLNAGKNALFHLASSRAKFSTKGEGQATRRDCYLPTPILSIPAHRPTLLAYVV
ncbi:hypothetical protein ES708_35093 [subsurface metagenome]